MQRTDINRSLDYRSSGFRNLVDALEYAAEGETGINFYDGRGSLEHVLTYRGLRDEAMSLARRLVGLGCGRGSRVAIVAETDPMFHKLFFACPMWGSAAIAPPPGAA